MSLKCFLQSLIAWLEKEIRHQGQLLDSEPRADICGNCLLETGLLEGKYAPDGELISHRLEDLYCAGIFPL